MAGRSAAGTLALLEEESPELRTHALKRLLAVVDVHWSEISESIDRINELSEDEEVSYCTLAALVSSKCYFHLEEYDDALDYALSAGDYFDVDEKSEFVQTLISKCIDNYTASRAEGGEVDPRLAAVVDRMFQRCFNDGEYKQALGVALESHRLDMVEASITRSDDVPEMLRYCFRAALTLVQSRVFRQQVLKVLVTVLQAQARPNYFDLARAFQFLDDAKAVADMLALLASAEDLDSRLAAFQVAFDIVENQNQQFQLRVVDALPKRVAPKVEPSGDGAGAGEGDNGDADADGGAGAGDAGAGADVDMATGEGGGKQEEDEDAALWAALDKLSDILKGTVTVDLHVDFLSHHNHADLLIMQNIKDGIPERNSVLHHAALVCHAFMQCGTTIDTFLLNNLQWLKRASNWARFSATAAQGVVHKGHVREAMRVLEPYLPKDGAVAPSPYLEGGALYALGLIHANNGSQDVLEYLENALDNTQHAVLQHGACLGIGLAAMGTGNPALWTKLKGVLMQEDANAGEGAGIGIGLLLAGTGPSWGAQMEDEEPVQDMLTYAAETHHEKTSRGIAMALALMCYGREEEAMGLIRTMSEHKDAVLRYGGMYATGMAYVGTSNNDAIRLLLHVAVSDVSNDVRRAAVINLGFVLLNEPAQVPTLVSLLAESYNPHVRYGACTAVAVACAGTGMREALELLEPMTKDASDFVRQGALLGLSMVLQQETVAHCPAVKRVRTLLASTASDKHVPIMTRMGAVIGSGILDAGGRNSVISLTSRAGFRKMSAIIGMALFQQHWYWYPCVHMLSLSLTPTAVIGLNQDLKMPKGFSLVCNAKRKMFAYPPMLKVKKEEAKQRVKTVELSTTAKAKAKKRREEKAKREAEAKDGAGAGADEDVPMGGDTKPEAGAADTKADAGDDVDMAAGGGEDESKGKKEEEDENQAPFTVQNPGRVTSAQASFMAYNAEGQRYEPVRQDMAGFMGVVMLRDSTPEEEDTNLVEIKPPPAQAEEEEPEPPEPFEWVPN